MSNKSIQRGLIAATCFIASHPAVFADALITPVSAAYISPSYNSGPPTFTSGTYLIPDTSLSSETNLLNGIINGSGLSAPATLANYQTVTHTAPSFSAGAANAFASVDPGSAGGDFFADVSNAYPSAFGATNTPAGQFRFDLGSAKTVSGMVSWAYTFGGTGNSNNGNNVKSWSFSFFNFDDAFLGSTSVSGPDAGMLSGGSYTFEFGSPVNNVRYVTAKPVDNYFGTSGALGGDRLGVAEVRFLDVAQVPEPNSAFLLGAGVLGIISRRRR